MRILWVAAATAAAFTAALTFSAAPAAAGHCCGWGGYYGGGPVVYPVPVNPFYLVNQGPVYSGPGIIADNSIYYPTLPRPIVSIGGYAFVQPYYPVAMQYPYVQTYGGWRCRGGYGNCGTYGVVRPHFYRPNGFAPYGAQLYRAEPAARVITLQSPGY